MDGATRNARLIAAMKFSGSMMCLDMGLLSWEEVKSKVGSIRWMEVTRTKRYKIIGDENPAKRN